MKKHIATLLLVLLCLTPLAYGAEICRDNDFCQEDVGYLARMSGPMLGAGGAAACVTGTVGSIFDDGFEGIGAGGSDHVASWTNVSGTNDFSYALPTYVGKPSAPKCNYGLRLTPTESAAQEMLDLGGTYTESYIKFDLYVSSHSLAGATQANILSICGDTGQVSCLSILQLRSSDGSDTLLRIADIAATTYAINKETWYTIEIQFLESAGTDNCFVKVDGTTRLTFDGNTIPGTPRYVFLGTSATNRTYDITFAYIGADADGVW